MTFSPTRPDGVQVMLATSTDGTRVEIRSLVPDPARLERLEDAIGPVRPVGPGRWSAPISELARARRWLQRENAPRVHVDPAPDPDAETRRRALSEVSRETLARAKPRLGRGPNGGFEILGRPCAAACAPAAALGARLLGRPCRFSIPAGDPRVIARELPRLLSALEGGAAPASPARLVPGAARPPVRPPARRSVGVRPPRPPSGPRRVLWPALELPCPVGSAVRLPEPEGVAVLERVGDAFRLRSAIALVLEAPVPAGSWVRYLYLRAPTVGELARLEGAERRYGAGAHVATGVTEATADGVSCPSGPTPVSGERDPA